MEVRAILHEAAEGFHLDRQGAEGVREHVMHLPREPVALGEYLGAFVLDLGALLGERDLRLPAHALLGLPPTDPRQEADCRAASRTTDDARLVSGCADRDSGGD